MPSTEEVILKLLIGTVLGGIIGFERQSHGRPAGFRTQLLVCVSCVLIMIISESYYAQGALRPEFARIDPTRLAAGAMTGVGFLGAGVILKTGVTIQGLTTAACIWIVSAIGLAIGAGQYTAGVAGFVITVFSLWVLRNWEVKMPRVTYKSIVLLTDDSADQGQIESILRGKGFEIIRTDYHFDFSAHERRFAFTVSIGDQTPVKPLIDDFAGLPSVRKVDVTG
jgi:putative Mg2+ transporter-C (MgtC) family protein